MKCEVAVVGGGIMGSAAAAALAVRGKDVVLFDRFEVGHNHGSSHGTSRIFRLSYPEEHHVAMAQDALELWRRWSFDAGELLITTGGIDTGFGIDANAAALEACDAHYEILEADDAARFWPDLGFPEGSVLYQPDAGIVLADRAWAAFTQGAEKAGARLLHGRRVERLDPSGDGVRLSMDDDTFEADVVVVTAGPWARTLLSTADIDLHVTETRETVAFFRAEEHPYPPTYVDWGDRLVYALPAPGIGIKVGEHHAGPVADPDVPGAPDGESVARLCEWMKERFPVAEREPHHLETCFYTSTENEEFVLERHGDIVVGSACSGHGFKFAPLIGERLADLAVE
jgi:sarcosine oxidase